MVDPIEAFEARIAEAEATLEHIRNLADVERIGADGCSISCDSCDEIVAVIDEVMRPREVGEGRNKPWLSSDWHDPNSKLDPEWAAVDSTGDPTTPKEGE